MTRAASQTGPDAVASADPMSVAAAVLGVEPEASTLTAASPGSPPDRTGWGGPPPLGLPGHLRLYSILVGAHMRSQMQYKVALLLRTLGSLTGNAVDIGAVAVIFGQIPHLAGWTLPEVALLYGMSAVCFSTAELIGSSLDRFEEYIRQGTFDRVMVRPLGAFFQMLAEELALRRSGRVAQGAIVLVLALHNLPIAWTPERVVILAGALVGGFTIYFSIFVFRAAFCFWTVQGTEAMNIFTYGGDFMASYPLDIYSTWLRRFITFVVPLAFINYYPALLLLDRADPMGLPGWARYCSPLAAALCAAAAWWVWQAGCRRYQSTGS